MTTTSPQALSASGLGVPSVVGFDHQYSVHPRLLSGLLGGKGAYLAEMTTRLALPVPPGFTITTEACARALDSGDLDGLSDEIFSALSRLEHLTGRRFGGADNPLLVSVRSGAPVSMPGMMDTVLNVGMNPSTAAGLSRFSGSADFGWDCYVRFAAMYASAVCDSQLDVAGAARRIAGDFEKLADRMTAFDEIIARHVSMPTDPREQLLEAIKAVINSWNSNRARTYRRIERVPDLPCTAVTVQAMVFGNLDGQSGSGVAFTRDPATGEARLVADWLANAQGEDVVAGTHRTGTMMEFVERLPDAAAGLTRAADILERHLGDMCDIEFTVERGVLWILQARVGKRSPQAALRIAIDMAEDPTFSLDKGGAVERTKAILANPPHLSPSLATLLPDVVLHRGIGVSPGIGVGRACFTPDAVADVVARGEPTILVRHSTSPADVHGMADSAAIVTQTGGAMSHAAVVARGWGIPAVVGLQSLRFSGDGVTVGDECLKPGAWMSVDGSSGEIALCKVAYTPVRSPEVAVLMHWAAELSMDIEATSQALADTASEKPPTRLDLAETSIVLLSIKGMTSVADVAAALMIATVAVAEILDALVVKGIVEVAKRGYRLTAAGNQEAVAIIARQRTVTFANAETNGLLESFDLINQTFKTTISAWQVRLDGTPNDHQDAEYDSDIMSRIADVHGAVSVWLDTLSLPLAALFRDRLNGASLKIASGEKQWLLSPRVDSYHSVWFEMHEYLIRVAGRNRADEAIAGRAQ